MAAVYLSSPNAPIGDTRFPPGKGILWQIHKASGMTVVYVVIILKPLTK